VDIERALGWVDLEGAEVLFWVIGGCHTSEELTDKVGITKLASNAQLLIDLGLLHREVGENTNIYTCPCEEEILRAILKKYPQLLKP
jgi:hypothetical protein